MSAAGNTTTKVIGYGAISASIGSQSMVQLKVLSMIAQAVWRGETVSVQLVIVALFFFVGTYAFWLLRAQRGLHILDGATLIPIMQAFWLPFHALSCGLFFEEFKLISLLFLPVYAIGVLLVLSGLYLLVPSPLTLEIPKEDDHEEDQEKVRLMNSKRAYQRMRKVTTFVGPGLTDLLTLPKFEGGNVNDTERIMSNMTTRGTTTAMVPRGTIAVGMGPRATMEMPRIHANRGTVPVRGSWALGLDQTYAARGSYSSNEAAIEEEDDTAAASVPANNLLRRWSNQLLEKAQGEDKRVNGQGDRGIEVEMANIKDAPAGETSSGSQEVVACRTFDEHLKK